MKTGTSFTYKLFFMEGNTALLEDAVHVTEYDEPEPDRVPRLHPDAEISPTMKSVASSLNVKVREMAAVLVVPPEAGVFTEVVVIVTVGSVMSCSTKTFPESVEETVA